MRNEDRPEGQNTPAAPDTSREPDYTVAFSPRQVAGGFAILAALILLLVRRRHGKKKS
jgi:hypothetical protein